MRARGALNKFIYFMVVYASNRSPPRVWGKHEYQDGTQDLPDVHPHVCGENLLRNAKISGVIRSPPRVWGKLSGLMVRVSGMRPLEGRFPKSGQSSGHPRSRRISASPPRGCGRSYRSPPAFYNQMGEARFPGCESSPKFSQPNLSEAYLRPSRPHA